MFLKKKPTAVMITLLDKSLYLSELARQANVTYVYLTHLIPMFRSKGLVEIEAKGKFRVAKLTPKGRELAQLLLKVKEKEK